MGATSDPVGRQGVGAAAARPEAALGQVDVDCDVVDRFELLHAPAHAELADLVMKDIARVSPETEVRCLPMAIDDPWDFEEVYAALHDFARQYAFAPDREDYLVHITTGIQLQRFVHGVSTSPRTRCASASR